MNKEYDCPHGGDPCSTILPGGVDLCVDCGVCKVRADVTVERVRSVLIWGCVTDCAGAAVSGALVKLLKYIDCGEACKEVCRTNTDCQGRYQFDLENGCEGRYRVVVSKGADLCPPPCCPPPCPCPEPGGPSSCRCRGSSSGGCKSVSRSNVQYY